jgi:hypothetical protein
LMRTCATFGATISCWRQTRWPRCGRLSDELALPVQSVLDDPLVIPAFKAAANGGLGTVADT